MPNQLINQSSPYLVQHAHNPVAWYPWGEEALTRARTENKPIFLSIGYAACHWCHVMAHESFEDPATAAIMNEYFINIKVDREERPDIDNIYMTATVAMTGSGGWPMSVFLTPDLRPFYAGTYFPPVPRYNMPSFQAVLQSIARAWQQERNEVEESSHKITTHLQNQHTYAETGVLFSQSGLDEAASHLHSHYDWGFGGWGQAPKFPQPMTVDFLLRRSKSLNSPGTKAALHALQAMARGGMYDVVGGGFSRYSTDVSWKVPHFEKMLYDNAQLIRAYTHAWQITQSPFYRRIAEESLAFIQREMTHPQGGFYASLDADSEGEEGKFYTWQSNEIEIALGPDWDFFKAAYGISKAGNWEGKTILQRTVDDATLASRHGLTPEGLAAKLADCHSKLLALRSQRIRPGTDDKILTAWNGMMLSACAEAARAFAGEEAPLHPGYHAMATRSADFLLTTLRPNGQLRRAWRDGQISSEVFLEDFAALALGLLDLYETDFNPRWFQAAQSLADEMIARFSDPQGGFFDTASDAAALLLRPKDLQDNATPSGNALAVELLLRLAAFTDRVDYRSQAEQSFNLVAEHALRYPTAFARWLQAADLALASIHQIAILGDPAAPSTRAFLQVARAGYRPNRVVALSPVPTQTPPLLQERTLRNDQSTAYLCLGFVCQAPTTDPQELEKQLTAAS